MLSLVQPRTQGARIDLPSPGRCVWMLLRLGCVACGAYWHTLVHESVPHRALRCPGCGASGCEAVGVGE
jgi:hypothetical protein